VMTGALARFIASEKSKDALNRFEARPLALEMVNRFDRTDVRRPRPLPHDRHLRLNSGGAVALGAGLDRLD
jgi:hypothetical protein